jgi:benzil reductase ((S)-benzoin forming)
MKLALITGGSKGLGRSLREQLIRLGFHVMEYSRSAPHPWSISVDLSNPKHAANLISESLRSIRPEECENIVVISNAGVLAPIGLASKKPISEIEANLNINLTSPILAVSVILAHFQDAPCRKVLASISSGAALKSYFGWSLYCAAKAGMEAYIETIALEQQREQAPFIPINIDPNVIDTDMQRLIRETSPQDFPDVARFQRRKTEGYLAHPDVVADQVLRIIMREDLTPGARYEV